jgi:heparan-alpha-glucosaminide N-acetyltransferase
MTTNTLQQSTESLTQSTHLARVTSIDVLRALTMILMIFVNDLWSLKDIPAWLGHVERGVDGIGLADIVFPAFLFIVGLSMPFSIDARRKKGATDRELVRHVLLRAAALLIMGVYLVNGENLNAEATGFQRGVWNTLCCASFILIWNSYPKTANKNLVYAGRVIGFIVLLVLALVYRGGDEGEIQQFGTWWWGILGLIGWAYLVSGLVSVFAKNNIAVIFGAWVFFAVLSMVSHADLLPRFLNFIPDAIRGGTLTGLTIGGVLTALIFNYFRNRNENTKLTIVLGAFALVLVILSVITRPYWGLAKLGATPAWLFLCSAFTIFGLIVTYWVCDVWGKSNWFFVIRPAGTDTLLCYLIPYFSYATIRFLGINLPEAVLVGGIGLTKSFLFAILCAVITGWLSKVGIRLKL